MRQAWIIVVVLLLLSLAGNWIQYRSAELAQRDRNMEAKEFRNQAAAQTAKIAARDSATAGRIKKLKKDSLSHAAVQGSLKSQIRAFRVKVQNLPPAVHDTLIVLQDSLIQDLSAERDTLYLVNTAVIDSLQKSNLELSELFKGQLRESIRLQGQVDREKRRRFSIGPHVGYGFRGADVGISVQYSIFRF